MRHKGLVDHIEALAIVVGNIKARRSVGPYEALCSVVMVGALGQTVGGGIARGEDKSAVAEPAHAVIVNAVVARLGSAAYLLGKVYHILGASHKEIALKSL